MTTFDLHIVRRLVLGFVFLLAVLIVFYVVLHYVEFIDDFMDRGAAMRDVFLVYYPSLVPDIVRLTTPLALFLSCVFLTGKLAQEFQLLALQTSGVSLYRLMVPFVLVGTVVSAAMFAFTGWIVPQTNDIVLNFEKQYLKDAPRQMDVTDIHLQNSPGSILAVGYYDRDSQTAHRVSMQQFDRESRMIHRVDADKMMWVDSLNQWRLSTVRVRRMGPSVEILRQFDTLDTLLHVLPRDLARTERDVESMTIPEARHYIESLRRAGVSSTGRPEVTYYSKFSYPLASLIVILLGVPLASVRRRRGQAIQLAIGLFVAFVYLSTLKVIEPLGYAGALSPVLAAWLPHGLFAMFALIALIAARK